jgi:hypothetical protein
MSIARQRSTSLVVGAIATIAAVFTGLAGGSWLFSAALLMVVGVYLLLAGILRWWPVERIEQ